MRQFGIGFGHGLFHAQRLGPGGFARSLGQILRRADTCDHIFALRIDQPFTVIGFLTSRRVTGKGHARCTGIAHIAEHHGLYVDRSAHIMGNVIQAAVDLGPLTIPTIKHSADRAPQLLLRVLRERCILLFCDDTLIFAHQSAPIIGRHFGIGVIIIVFLGDLQRFFK